MGMDEAGFWRASMRSDYACVTAYFGERIWSFFYAGNSSVVMETYYDSVLGVYYLRHQ